MKGAFPNRSAARRIAWIYSRFLSTRLPLTLEQLSVEYEVSKKTIQRDIEMLRDLGCNIIAVYNDPLPRCFGLRMVDTFSCPFCKSTHRHL